MEPIDFMKNAILTRVTPEIVMPEAEWRAKKESGGYSTNSIRFWKYASRNPVSLWREQFEKVKCREHNRYELVPSGSYHYGGLNIWYDAGLHPRWGMWDKAYAHGMTRIDISRLRWSRPIDNQDRRTRFNKHLQKYKNDPLAFFDWARTEHKKYELVPLVTGGRTWRVTRGFKQRYKLKNFVANEWLNEGNQTNKRLMLMSGSFKIETVLSHMTVMARDNDGIIYRDNVNAWTIQDYLYVKCPTTGQTYLLGIPAVLLCLNHRKAGNVDLATGAVMNHCWDMDRSSIGWTPAAARRWTLGVEADAEIIAEA